MNPAGTPPTPPAGAGPAIDRREAVRRIALLMGGALVGSRALLDGQAVPPKAGAAAFTDDERSLLDEIGETIIPATGIPGAKAVQIGAFMAMMVTDCYDERDHAVFRNGLSAIDEASRAAFGKSFLACSAQERTAVASSLDAQQVAHGKKKAATEPEHYFRMMKELTTLGYFSSEVGCTMAVRYIEVPGAFHGDIPYKKGDRAWF